MRKAKVFVHGKLAGYLEEHERGRRYVFSYLEDYSGDPVSLCMLPDRPRYQFKNFPPFFDGVLPEGDQLEALLRQKKIDKNDFFSQLMAVGADLVGAVTVEEYS